MSQINNLLKIVNERIRDLQHDKAAFYNNKMSIKTTRHLRNQDQHRHRIHDLLTRHRTFVHRPEEYLHNLVVSEKYLMLKDLIDIYSKKYKHDLPRFYELATKLTALFEHEKTHLEIEQMKNTKSLVRQKFIEAFKELKIFTIFPGANIRHVNQYNNDFRNILQVIKKLHKLL